MKRHIGLTLAILFLGIIPAAGQGEAPNISFARQTRDFAKVTAGETLRHVFNFTNKGNAVLEIFQVRPT